ncbi:hypothetical protein Pmani_003183 [Petrolisthes manimaculis]|uniref:Uncharacterized protein n=1 Tax=Petrolisthes manimaculis TaxID=1843537 RepID=A0AAE1QHC5_9EUCA|nr:hypothetical protein Pmani_006768 [Petrolisthes manimaculis]KAK4326320.1 hypothetical protein Pmani_003183 [Petrolisthes manimaculis]
MVVGVLSGEEGEDQSDEDRTPRKREARGKDEGGGGRRRVGEGGGRGGRRKRVGGGRKRVGGGGVDKSDKNGQKLGNLLQLQEGVLKSQVGVGSSAEGGVDRSPRDVLKPEEKWGVGRSRGGVVRAVQVGVVSFGSNSECRSDSPDGQARVAALVDWIMELSGLTFDD